MNFRLRLWIGWVIGFGMVSLQAEPNPKGVVPPVDFVQAKIWRNLRLQDFKLEGIVRTEKKVYPIILRTLGREMIYEFQDQPLQVRVVLSPDVTILERRISSKVTWTPVTGKERLNKILDTDMTYEDLGLEFIRWDEIRTLGTDSIKTLPAWAFEAKPPGISSYAKARYWISSEFFAFLRIDAYNSKNQVVKRVEINGVQKIGNAYVIKEMQLSSIIPGRDLSSSRTYVEIRTGEPGKSGIH